MKNEKISFVDLKRQYESIKNEINNSIQEVIDNTAFISGSYARQFEEKFSDLIGAKYCISTS